MLHTKWTGEMLTKLSHQTIRPSKCFCLLILLCLLFTSCSTTSYYSKTNDNAENRFVKISVENPAGYFNYFHTQVGLRVIRLDDQVFFPFSFTKPLTTLYVLPGEHNLRVYHFRKKMRFLNIIRFNAEMGKSYTIKGELRGFGSHVWVEDDSTKADSNKVDSKHPNNSVGTSSNEDSTVISYKTYPDNSLPNKKTATICGKKNDPNNKDYTRISILKVDDASAWGRNEIQLAPGKHTIRTFCSNGFWETYSNFWLVAEAGKSYVLRSSFSGWGNIAIWIEEKETGKKVGGIRGSVDEP